MANTVNVSYLEGQNPVAPDAVTAYGPDLFGDRINLFNLGLEFEQTDLSLPGNSALPVALVRKHTPGRANSIRGQFGDWDLESPRISGTFSRNSGWVTTNGGVDRCSGLLTPPAEPRNAGAVAARRALRAGRAAADGSTTLPPNPGPGDGGSTDVAPVVGFIASDFWNGIHLSAAGQGTQEVLQRSPAYLAAPSDGAAYPLVTRNNWQISCLDAVLNAPGQGFVAVSPQGVRYVFNWMASRDTTSVKKTGGSLARKDMFLMATRVADRHGQWVDYTYDPANPLLLTRIQSSDGRVITITNAGGRAVSASDGTRTFQYSYGSLGELTGILQPDGSRWTFNLTPMVPANLVNLGEGATCDQPGDFSVLTEPGRITHPSGAVGVFTTDFLLFGRTGVERACKYVDLSSSFTTGAVWPQYVASQGITRKEISGPGLPALVWSYQQQANAGWSTCTTAACTSPRLIFVTEPSGNQTRHTFGSRWRVDEGQLQKVEQGWNGTTALKTTTYRYRASAGTQAYPDQFGSSPLRNSDWLAQRNRPQDQRVITLQGDTFTWEVDATSAGFDALARPLKVRRFSSLGDTRTDATAYFDHPGKWVLGQVASLKELTTNRTEQQHDYDPLSALPVRSWAFGRLVKSYAYNADGTLNTVFDAANRPTRLASHKRGKPQLVTHPDGVVESQVINNLGNADSRTNAVGGVTRFSYDAMGRVSLIEPPGGDPVAYHPTVQVFEQVGTAELGLAAGHWRQTVTTGNARTVRYFDALWRERLEARYDAANPGGTSSFEETRYDLDGRTAFVSYPERNFTVLDAARPGKWTTYDAIGRVARQVANSELGDLTSETTYFGKPFKKKVQNPRGFSTFTHFQAFDEPTEDSVDRIEAPESVTITFTRDVFGKATRITRSGGTASVTRRYVYDAEQRLCKTIEPESGATVQAYDTAGNVAWRASGMALSSSTSCNQSNVTAGRKINFAYDARDRLIRTTYGDGSTQVTRSYKADGLPSTISTDLFTWTLEYNNARLLTSETLTSPLGTHGFSYGIDNHRQVATMTYPGGPTLSYTPDAFGRPTRISGYASGITYHPNGQLAGYTAGNGIAFSLSLNTRGLPQTWRHAGVVQDRYTYDLNGNVTAITDQQEGLSSRTMAYDGLDRLVGANGTWGIGSYGYDALDNLVSSQVGPRSLAHLYDTTTNRLTGVSGSVTASIAYDANGNVTSRAGQVFTFDIGNRLTAAAGIAGYYYDGHGRRAGVQTVAGRNVLRIYSQSGKLLLTQDTGNGPTGGVTKHIHLGDRVIAENHSATGNRWLHTDALGSPVAVTNQAGAVLERTRYEPYGLTAAGTNRDGIGYTGHVNDVDTGLVYMQQRYYDPYAGRFLSVDPVVTDTEAGRGFNRYEYANSNPYLYTDPDGRESCTGSHIACRVGGLAAGFSGAVNSFVRVTDSTITGGFGLKASTALRSGEGLQAVGFAAAGAVYGLMNVATLGEGGAFATLAGRGVQAGQAGAFGALKGLKGDGLTAHHMPQAAAGRTGYNEGGALVLTQAEHVATRTYGSKGIGTLQSDAALSFRSVLAKDIRDVRGIVGTRYNDGLRDLTDYYRKNFPELMGK